MAPFEALLWSQAGASFTSCLQACPNLRPNQEITCQGNAPARGTLVVGGFLCRTQAGRYSCVRYVLLITAPQEKFATCSLLFIEGGIQPFHLAATVRFSVAPYMKHARAVAAAGPGILARDIYRSCDLSEWNHQLGRCEALRAVDQSRGEIARVLRGSRLAHDLCLSHHLDSRAISLDACGIRRVHAPIGSFPELRPSRGSRLGF